MVLRYLVIYSKTGIFPGIQGVLQVPWTAFLVARVSGCSRALPSQSDGHDAQS